MLNNASTYGLSKPLVIGEFNHMYMASNTWWTGVNMYQDIYNKGFAGAWGW